MDLKWRLMRKDGTGYASFKNTVVPSAGKTGTAEVFQNGESRVNSTYIGYAPLKILNYHSLLFILTSLYHHLG